MEIDNIIFDLGRVIVEIDPGLTIAAFKKLCKISQFEIETLFENETVLLFELGKISETEFLSRFKNFLVTHSDETAIASAWDAMICGVSFDNINLLRKLKNQFSIYALSNTNCRHIKVINQYLMSNYLIKDLSELFHKVYYSFELELAKPDKKIFEHVLEDSQLCSRRTLFIDDNFANICTARELKFQTIHLSDQKILADELRKMGILG